MLMLRQRQGGFTIVELLIVIVVIAILATISVVAYNGIQNRANDAAVQSDLRNIGQKVVSYQVLNDKYPNSAGTFSSAVGPGTFKVSAGAYGNHYTPAASNGYNMAYCLDSTVGTGGFALIAASKSGTVYVFKNGSVAQGIGPLKTIGQLCTDNGQPTPHSSTWLYSNGSWQTSWGISDT